MTGEELLQRIPQRWRDIPHRDLLGQSPTQVVADGHVEGCLACQRALEAMAVCGARWVKYHGRVCGLPADHDGDHRSGEISFPASESTQ